MKRVLVLLVVLAMTVTVCSFGFVTMAQENDPTIALEYVEAQKGDEVSVQVFIENNPGIWGMDIKISYDKTALTLVGVENGGFFQESEWTKGIIDADVYVLSYECNDFADIETPSGLLATLTFKVSDTADKGEYTIDASYIPGDIINIDFDDIHFDIVAGCISVAAAETGDNSMNSIAAVLLSVVVLGVSAAMLYRNRKFF